MTAIRWNHHTSEWTATLPEGTPIHSHSYREVEDLLHELDNPAARRRDRVANAVAIVTVTTFFCIVTAVAAWLW
jgi:hypothetical protein